jgi:reactive intermediate/imine deaminase
VVVLPFRFATGCRRDSISGMKFLCTLLLVTSSAVAQSDRRHIPGPRPDLPFSAAVVVGNTIYLAGQIGLEAKTNKPPEKVEDEARLVMEEIKKALAASGGGMDDLVYVQVFCSDVAHYGAFNAVYRTYFKDKFPARAFVGSGKLLFNARFEVQGIAVRNVK